MASSKKTRRTTVGRIEKDVLAFTVGKDPVLDKALVEYDCIGSAAHVTMLSKMPVRPKLFSKADRDKVVAELRKIMKQARKGTFEITMDDQDVHMAVERVLTAKLGDLGRKIHTARSRNDQVAVDLRLYAKDELLGVMDDILKLAAALLKIGKTHERVPMVGRTHMQPAMPSSVGLFMTAYVEGLLDDVVLVMDAYQMNDQCPLGSAAGYGVPLPIDRELTGRLLGFSRTQHNVLYASNSRGKYEVIILNALSQVMGTLSRLSTDLILYSMPEFGYFVLPEAYCTGSSIMPQKKNPDVLELVRAKASRVSACSSAANDLLKALPGGYNRDLQDAKEPFMEGINTTRASLQIMASLCSVLDIDREALLKGFTPDVFATDVAIGKVAVGMPFRDAYDYVKTHLEELEQMDPQEAVDKKTHFGGTAGLDFPLIEDRIRAAQEFSDAERSDFEKTVSKLLGVKYPALR